MGPLKRVKQVIGKTWLKAFGWEVDGGAPDVAKAVVLAAPHTSNWDFPFTLAVTWAVGVDIAWLGKRQMFIPGFRRILKFIGGIPVDRSAKHNLVSQVADKLKSADNLYVIVPPEGTRANVGRWKTGFYYMAVEADVPIVMGYLDFGKKKGGFGTLFYPTGDLSTDAEVIRAFYKDVRGKRPDLFTEVKFAEKEKQPESPVRERKRGASRLASAAAVS